MTRAVTNRVSVSTLHPYLRFPRDETIRLVRSVLKGERSGGWVITVAFVTDRRMRQLNAEFLGPRRTTDVLSFLYEEGRGKEGDVVVCLDQVRRQAPRFDVSYSAEVARVVIHGVLHLLGYDDHTPRTRERMKAREDRYLGTTYA